MAEDPRRRPSHREIARRSGVSQATVSRALKNDPRISRETRVRIQAVASELGYRPSPVLEKAMQEMSRIRQTPLKAFLGFIMGSRMRHSWYARDIREGALARADALGYMAECFFLEEDRTAAAILERQLRSRNIRGLLILPLDQVEADPALAWDQYAVVNTTSLQPRLAFHSVHNDDFGNSERLLKAIFAKGFRRPGLVISSDIDRRMHHALSANYHWTWAESLGERSIPPFLLDPPLPGLTFRKWVDRYQPDALLVADATMRDRLQGDLPADAPSRAWIGYSQDAPHLPGLLPDFRNIGSAAVDLLTAQLMRDEYGIPEFTKRVMVQARLHGLPDPLQTEGKGN